MMISLTQLQSDGMLGMKLMVKLYTSKEWLRRKYVKEGLTIDQIAALCGVGKSTIDNYVKKFGLQFKRRRL